jgi:hypothetical protein
LAQELEGWRRKNFEGGGEAGPEVSGISSDRATILAKTEMAIAIRWGA